MESPTLMTSLLDHSGAGEIGTPGHRGRRPRVRGQDRQGRRHARTRFAAVFSALRSNDLIWQYVVGNYLKGNKPQPFDLFYWNSDSTNLPGPCFTWYLRNMYLSNNLRVPGKLVMLGRKIDLGKINVPSYIMAAREDHLVLWNAAYLSRKIWAAPPPSRWRPAAMHRRLDQPGVKNRLQLLVERRRRRSADRRRWLAGRSIRRVAGGRTGPHGWASAAADRRAEEAGQRDLQGDQTGAGRYVEGEGHLIDGDRWRCSEAIRRRIALCVDAGPARVRR